MRKEKDCGKKVTVIEASEFRVVSVNKEILIHKHFNIQTQLTKEDERLVMFTCFMSKYCNLLSFSV